MEIHKQIQEVLEQYPELQFSEFENTFTGKLEIFEHDFYTVLIDITPWNKSFPRVYETAERIPKKPDRHVYTTAGNCCFTTPRFEEIYLKTKVKTLVHFIDRILIPYLQNNSYYELHATYFNGEFAHTGSTLQTYQTLLKIEDSLLIMRILKEYIQGIKFTNKHLCYCGSGQTFRKCTQGTHKLGYEKLKYIDIQNIKIDLLILMGDFKEQLKI